MKLFAKQLLTVDGWRFNQLVTIEAGIITDICETHGDMTENDADMVKGIVIPGMVNCHSHAFQRAFAGFSEQGSEGKDSFWTWRRIMYQFLEQLTVADAQLIAQQLYIEMLKQGYTRVAEFHYLHHDQQGQQHESPAAMAEAIFKAANTSGIGLTMLPVLYRFSGFGPQAANDGQKRFIHSVADFNCLVDDCFTLAEHYGNSNVGIAPHSLRAVDKPSLVEAVAHVRAKDANAPIHIHIAEQQKEVNDCIAHYGQRPVEWLLDNMTLDQHWCLIHATHIDEQERRGIVASGAIAGICPTTEANLGDGIFPTAEFVGEQGKWAIGSDSHISVNPVEELRWLEYAQRLTKQQRAILATDETPSVGQYLWQSAAQGGAQSTSSNTGAIAIGKQADLLVLDDAKLSVYASGQQYCLDSLVFASSSPAIADVMVNGKWVVTNGEHAAAQETHEKFSALLSRLSG
ncbi:formimidoylglutamate deiminase [Thalassotalea euphylliae]|uniref:Formimidoylglutamate deiminase n=1 Tax=Thalassotalea euphylliae TaxID=1655234 RepID=A0A3E0TVH2_9GAMM|nr:formimidoylglutamate deiminase [Thalassotalea euphylliae]REL28588.1 formimidoylglutamate deiminase [Thalassotalea euphylliae]